MAAVDAVVVVVSAAAGAVVAGVVVRLASPLLLKNLQNYHKILDMSN